MLCMKTKTKSHGKAGSHINFKRKKRKKKDYKERTLQFVRS